MEQAYAEKYGELYRKHWWWRARERALLQTIRHILPERGPIRILDIGCGDGLFFDELAAFGAVEGLEPEASLIRSDNPHRSRIYPVTLADFRPSQPYDLVLLLDVLEHVDDPAGYLRSAVALLNGHGKVIVTVPAFRSLWTTHDDLNHHRTRFTRSTFRAVASQAGMDLREERYLFQWTAIAKLMVRVLERIRHSAPQPPTIPWPPINRLLYGMTALEETMGRIVPLPFGSSLLLVGVKKKTYAGSQNLGHH